MDLFKELKKKDNKFLKTFFFLIFKNQIKKKKIEL